MHCLLGRYVGHTGLPVRQAEACRFTSHHARSAIRRKPGVSQWQEGYRWRPVRNATLQRKNARMRSRSICPYLKGTRLFCCGKPRRRGFGLRDAHLNERSAAYILKALGSGRLRCLGERSLLTSFDFQRGTETVARLLQTNALPSPWLPGWLPSVYRPQRRNYRDRLIPNLQRRALTHAPRWITGSPAISALEPEFQQASHSYRPGLPTSKGTSPHPRDA